MEQKNQGRIMQIKRQMAIANVGTRLLLLGLLNAVVLQRGYTANEQWYWWLCVTIPLLLVVLYQFISLNKKKSKCKTIKMYRYENNSETTRS